MKRNVLSMLLIAGSLGVFAQAAKPVLVKDINPLGDANPMWVTGLGPRVVFFAENGVNGSEIWAYDTSATLQYDLNPGGASSSVPVNNRQMAQVGNTLYFPADNGSTGTELYKWDGTAAPLLAAEIRSGSLGSNINQVFAHNGRVYFNANNGITGNELWSLTTQTNYVQQLTDINAGAANSNPNSMVVYKNKIYFTATGIAGAEMYVYDPANNSSVLVADIMPGIGSSDPQGYLVINNKLYFSAYTTTYGRELYSFDSVNIMRHTNIDNGNLDGVVTVAQGQTQLSWYKNKIYFAGDNGVNGAQLYEYNPANGVAMQVFPINPLGSSMPENFINYAGKLFFSANDGTHGAELWYYNGTINPVMVADIDTLAGSSPMNFLRMGTKLYFSATTFANGHELYRFSDSAALGIQSVRFAADVKVYPNPTTNAATIAVNTLTALQFGYVVTDITGKIITSSEVKTYDAGTHTIQIDMQALLPGIYNYRLTDANGSTLAAGRIQKQ